MWLLKSPAAGGRAMEDDLTEKERRTSLGRMTSVARRNGDRTLMTDEDGRASERRATAVSDLIQRASASACVCGLLRRLIGCGYALGAGRKSDDLYTLAQSGGAQSRSIGRSISIEIREGK